MQMVQHILNSFFKQPKFLIAVIALLVASIALTVGLIAFYQLRATTMYTDIQDEQRRQAQSVANKIENYLISTRQLAATTASLIAPLRDDKTHVETALKRVLHSAPEQTIYGTGAWFEPFTFNKTEHLFGPYAHRGDLKNPIVLTYDWTSQDYNFPTQPWYLAGKKADGEIIFTEPYFDTDMVYMSAAKAFFDDNKQFTGVITVDMVLPLLYELIRQENKDENETLYVVTKQDKIFIHPDEKHIIEHVKVNDGKEITSILDLHSDELAHYEASLNLPQQLHVTASVAYVGWTVHLRASERYLTRDIADFWGNILYGIGLLWLLSIAGLIALIRIAMLSYQQQLEHTRLETEIQERREAEARLQTANEQKQLLEQKVAERTRDLANAYKRLKASQTQLVQSEKMAGLGQMVAGLAHEINTPLGYIRNNVEMVRRAINNTDMLFKDVSTLAAMLTSDNVDEAALGEHLGGVVETLNEFEEDEVLRETYQLIDDTFYGVDQISELVINLKDFSRLDLAKVDNVNLNQCVDAVLNIAHHKLKNHVTVNKQLDDIPKVKCSPSQINQVLINLITNGAQAIEHDNGMITIKTSADEQFVHISVQDNGKGIDKKHLSKIFDPFFTTKPVGEGTGLGLSISHQIMQQHNGKIRVASQIGKGTRFVISLPLSVSTEKNKKNESAAATTAEAA